MFFHTDSDQIDAKIDNIALSEVSQPGGIQSLNTLITCDRLVSAFANRLKAKIKHEFKRRELVKIGLPQLSTNDLPDNYIPTCIGFTLVDVFFTILLLSSANQTEIIIGIIGTLIALVSQIFFTAWDLAYVAEATATTQLMERITDKLYRR